MQQQCRLCPSPFLLPMFLNYIEETFIRGTFQGIEIGTSVIVYNDDMRRDFRFPTKW